MSQLFSRGHDFRGTQDGEFPARWKLLSGQAVVNKVDGEPALLLTEGNYAKVEPRMTANASLPDSFTIEFDFFPKSGGFEKLGVQFNYQQEDGLFHLEAPHLKGTYLLLDEPSVTGTANIIMAAVFLVLLVTCMNTAALLLSRAVKRSPRR